MLLEKHTSNNGYQLLKPRKSDLVTIFLALAVTLSLTGYSTLLMLYSNTAGGIEGSRNLTVPIRLSIIVLLCAAYGLGARNNKHPALIFFLAFSAVYLVRIMVEWQRQPVDLYRPPLEFLLYFVSFTLAPLLIISSIPISEKAASLLLKSLFWTAVAFSLLTIAFYMPYIGQTTRLSLAVGYDDAYISPLALSYQSGLMLGVILISWFVTRTLPTRQIWVMLAVALLMVPFFLGASRGSVVALAFVLCFFLAFYGKIKRRVTLTIGAIALTVLAIALQDHLGDGVFMRIASLGQDIEAGSTSAIRLVYWREGIEQFLISPLFGNSLQLETFRHHPHNWFIEVLITTGVTGFIPFCLFVFFLFRAAVQVINSAPGREWVVVVFLVGFTSNMFSGSIASSAITMTGAGLVLGVWVERKRFREKLRLAQL